MMIYWYSTGPSKKITNANNCTSNKSTDEIKINICWNRKLQKNKNWHRPNLPNFKKKSPVFFSAKIQKKNTCHRAYILPIDLRATLFFHNIILKIYNLVPSQKKRLINRFCVFSPIYTLSMIPKEKKFGGRKSLKKTNKIQKKVYILEV